LEIIALKEKESGATIALPLSDASSGFPPVSFLNLKD
jgi:hypothetical protein